MRHAAMSCEKTCLFVSYSDLTGSLVLSKTVLLFLCFVILMRQKTGIEIYIYSVMKAGDLMTKYPLEWHRLNR